MSRAQMRTPPHGLAEASFVPSGLKATLETAHPRPGRTSSLCARVRFEQPNRAIGVRYGDPRSVGTEGEAGPAPPTGPRSTATRDPLSTSLTSTSPSGIVAIRGPPGSKATPTAPSNVRTTSSRSQSQIVTRAGLGVRRGWRPR